MERKMFLRVLAGSVAGLAFTDPLSGFAARAANGQARRVGHTDAEQVRSMARVFASQDHGLVGGISPDTVAVQLRGSLPLLDGRFTSEVVRQQFFSAVAELADVAGGMYFDAGSFVNAERHFRFAAGCAIEGNDWTMRAKSLSGLVNLAVHQRRADDALNLAELALVRADQLPPVTRAVMYTRQARALGLSGGHREQDCLRAVRQAEDCFVAGTGDEPAWMTYYTHTRLERDTGRALLLLAVNGGDYGGAHTRLASAAQQFEPGTRGRMLTTANLAHLTMARDDPAHAVELGHDVLDSLGAVRSNRVFEALRQLRAAGNRHQSVPGIQELNERITTALAAN